MYVQRNIVGRSQNIYTYTSSAKIRAPIPDNSKTTLVGRFYVVGNNKIYLGAHVKYPILMTDFNQICNLL
jgi:hypothetical protein